MNLHLPENCRSHFIISCIITRRDTKTRVLPLPQNTFYSVLLPKSAYMRKNRIPHSIIILYYMKINRGFNLKREWRVYNVHLIGAFGRRKCKWHVDINAQIFIATSLSIYICLYKFNKVFMIVWKICFNWTCMYIRVDQVWRSVIH
jgi:hypothetical protein